MTRPSTGALTVLHAWPVEEWVPEGALADHLRTIGVDVTLESDGWRVGGTRPLRSILNEARRRGWLIRNRGGETDLYQLTPTGVTARSAGAVT